jgi:hypothetical protein
MVETVTDPSTSQIAWKYRRTTGVTRSVKVEGFDGGLEVPEFT